MSKNCWSFSYSDLKQYLAFLSDKDEVAECFLEGPVMVDDSHGNPSPASFEIVTEKTKNGKNWPFDNFKLPVFRPDNTSKLTWAGLKKIVDGLKCAALEKTITIYFPDTDEYCPGRTGMKTDTPIIEIDERNNETNEDLDDWFSLIPLKE